MKIEIKTWKMLRILARLMLDSVLWQQDVNSMRLQKWLRLSVPSQKNLRFAKSTQNTPLTQAAHSFSLRIDCLHLCKGVLGSSGYYRKSMSTVVFCWVFCLFFPFFTFISDLKDPKLYRRLFCIGRMWLWHAVCGAVRCKVFKGARETATIY